MLREGFKKPGLADVVARLLGFYRLVNESSQVVVRTATSQYAIEIMIEVGKEAGADLAVGGEPDAAASAAKGL